MGPTSGTFASVYSVTAKLVDSQASQHSNFGLMCHHIEVHLGPESRVHRFDKADNSLGFDVVLLDLFLAAF